MTDVEYAYYNAITLQEQKDNGENYKNFIINIDKIIKKQVMDKLPEKYQYLYRSILFNIVKKIKSIMVTDIRINKIYYLDEKIDIDVNIFSLCRGNYTKNYLIDLELAY